MLLPRRLSPLKSHAYGLLPGLVNTPKKVNEKSTTNNSHFPLRITYTTGGADHSVPKNLGPAFEKADENEKRLKTLREYFAKWKVDAESSETLLSERKEKVLEPAPLLAPAKESEAANKRTISLIAALALTIIVIANRKKMPNMGSMLNFLNRNPVIKG